MEKLPDMVLGYWSGRDSRSLEIPQCYLSKSAAYKHGWLNGRDDRVGIPRDKASVLRCRADMILNNI